MIARLNDAEHKNLDQWLQTRDVKKLLKNDGQLALVFSANSGIGVGVTATIKDKDGNIVSKDITDYHSW